MRKCIDHDHLGCPMTRINRVDGQGPVPCPIMLIGEAPSKNEDAKGMPFIGKSGDEMGRVYLEKFAGISRNRVYITHLVKCRTNDKDRDPNDAEVDACSAILRREIKDVQPQYVGLIGRISTQWMLGGLARMEKVHGFGYEVEALDGSQVRYTVMPLYHPAYGLHNTAMMRWIMEDFHRFGRLVRGDRRVMWQGREVYA